MHPVHMRISVRVVDLHQFEAFVATVRLGSISAAAGELGYSQSAVSRQLQGLEREVGAELLRRTARGVRPTARGRALLPHAQDIVASWEAARTDVAGTAERTRLRIGTFPAATAPLVAPALKRLERRRPDLVVGVRQAPSPELVSAVAAGELDGALVMEADRVRARRTLRVESVLVDEMVVVTPLDDPLLTAVGEAGSPRTALSDFAGRTWVEAPGRAERILREAAARAGFSPVRIRQAPDAAAKVAFVAAGLGVALVPALVVPPRYANLGVLHLDDPPRRGVNWLTRADRDPGPLDDVLAAFAGVRAQGEVD